MIQTFCNYLTYNRGLSRNTISSYAESLHSFARFINMNYHGTRWSCVTKHMIDEYVTTLCEMRYKQTTIKLHISALRTFYKTCMAMGTLDVNPARYVSTPRLGERLPKVIETQAIKRALEDPTTTPTARAVIAIVFETGMRMCELQKLQREDIDSVNRCIRVHGKGNKERIVYYGELTCQHGRYWRAGVYSDREVRRQVFNALKPHSKAPQLSPHAIRHTFASQLINNGMTMEAIRKLLGHEHLATTEIYAQMSNATAKQQYLQYRPQA